MGRFYAGGSSDSHGLRQNYAKALKLYHRAADLGHILILGFLIRKEEELKVIQRKLFITMNWGL